MLIRHVCDKEKFYYPGYINRFTKLGDMLKGWFKPLQQIFGEFVNMDKNQDDQSEQQDLDVDMRFNDEFAAVPGGSKNIVEESKSILANDVVSMKSQLDVLKPPPLAVATNQIVAIDRLMASPLQEIERSSKKKNLQLSGNINKRSTNDREKIVMSPMSQ